MNAAIDWLAANGGWLLLGTTLLLTLGVAAVAVVRAPVYRQRIGESTIACMLGWLLLACLPLPRIAWTRPAGPVNSIQGSMGDNREQLRRQLAELTLEARLADHQAAQQNGVQTGGPSAAPASVDRSLALPNRTAKSPTEPRGRRPSFVVLAPSATVPEHEVPEHGTAPARILPEIVAWAYFAGAIVCLSWLALGRLLLARLLGAAAPAEPWLQTLLDEQMIGAGSRRVKLLVSPLAGRPLSCGVWRPTIALPQACCRPEQAESLRCVLAHELVHVRRRDALSQTLFNLAFPLLFFHPLYWLLRRAVCWSRELIADDGAATHAGAAKYVGRMIALARQFQPQPRGVVVCAVALFHSPTQFFRRMNMLIERTDSLAARCSRAGRWLLIGAVAIVLAAMTVSLGSHSATAQTAPVAPPVTTEPPAAPVTGTAPALVPAPPTPGAPAAPPPTTDPVPGPARGTVPALVPAPPSTGVPSGLPVITEPAKPALPPAAGNVPAPVALPRPRHTRNPSPGFGVPPTADNVPRLAPTPIGAPPHVAPSPALNATQPKFAPGATPLGGRSLAPTVSHTTGVASDTSESGGLRLDLVRLAESYSAALSDLRASNVQLQRMEDTVKKLENAVPRSEIDAKRSSAESAAKKAALLRSIASVALELAEEELNLTRAEGDALQQAYKEGVVSRSAMLANSRIRARATANVKVLKLILSEGEPAKPLTVGEIFRRIGPAVSAEEAPADEPAADEEESVPGPAKPAPVELPPRR